MRDVFWLLLTHEEEKKRRREEGKGGKYRDDKQEIANTFSATDPYKRIDYIFYTKNTIEYHSGNVLKSFGDISDHLPVLMEFKLKH